MKLNKTKQSKGKLYLFKAVTKSNDAILKLKKKLNIIFKYNLKNKKILFVGDFNQNFYNLIQKTNHIFISKSNWINGLLTNSSSSIIFENLKKNKFAISNNSFFKDLIKLKGRCDLIVTINLSDEKKIEKEAYDSITPFISFNNLDFLLKLYEKNRATNVIYSMLNACLLKSTRKKTFKPKQKKIFKNVFKKKIKK